MMKRLLAIALLALSSLARAGQWVDVQIVDNRTQQVLEAWMHRGNLYVAGTPGQRYTVRLINKSGARVLSVVSVDGVNAVSGETAHPSQSGYVLNGGQSADVAGWRKSLEEVAAFYFTAIPDSYAARTDRPQHVGVIGVAVFNEHVPVRLRMDLADRAASGNAAEASRAAPTATAPLQKAEAQPETRLGTGHGERLTARVETTEFRRASDQPGEIIRIYYDSRANLIARGIIPNPVAMRPRPDPFPGRFVPDPRG